MKKRSRSKGLVVAFLGPDGSGKSTIISGLLAKKLPFERTDYFHLKPLYKKEGVTNTIVEDPHQYPPYGKFKSYFKLLVFIAQYNYGWINNITPLIKKSSLVIFDRYYDDLVVDFKRYRYGGSTAIAKWVATMIPKPSLYFILTADSHVILERKQEVSKEELDRQILEYRLLVDGHQYINIDVSKTPEEIVNELQVLILSKLHDR